jgi:CxxC-x17-CxxC domain-containing protein
MEFQDKTLQCATCGREFMFSAREQEFYHEKGFVEPKHCRECRQQRKRRRESYARQNQEGGEVPVSRQMFSVICAECGKPTQVPFKPLTGKPILCKDCFIQRRGEVIGEQPVVPESGIPDISVPVEPIQGEDVVVSDELTTIESPDSSSDEKTDESTNEKIQETTDATESDLDSKEEQPSEPEDDTEGNSGKLES